MNALTHKNGSFLSLIATSAILVLFLVLLIVPSSAAFTNATNQKGSTIVSNSVVTQKSSEYAGYELYSTKAGSTLYIQATWKIPTVTCAANSFFELNVQIAHTYSVDVGSQLFVVCLGAGRPAEYSMLYAIDGGYAGISQSVYAGDVMKMLASEDPMTGATALTIEDTTPGHIFSDPFNSKVPLNAGFGGALSWVMYSTPSSSLPVPAFTTFKIGGIKATVDDHTGSLGSFISIKGVTIYEEIMFNSADKHVLVKPTSITSDSTSFSLKWVTNF